MTRLVLTETRGDLFQVLLAGEHSLAHCVTQDLRMGKGIAVLFKLKFGNVKILREQNKSVGQAAILPLLDKDRMGHVRRFVYYLITKRQSNDIPTYQDLERSLADMRDHCVREGVKKLAIPKIGCGLDRLEWPIVKKLIEDVFCGVDMRIDVFYL